MVKNFEPGPAQDFQGLQRHDNRIAEECAGGLGGRLDECSYQDQGTKELSAFGTVQDSPPDPVLARAADNRFLTGMKPLQVIEDQAKSKTFQSSQRRNRTDECAKRPTHISGSQRIRRTLRGQSVFQMKRAICSVGSKQY